jgi:phage gp29-like protein
VEKTIAVVPLKDNFFTYPSYGLTPERLGRIFREADDGDPVRQMELFCEIEEKDPHIFSQFQIRKLKIQGLDWTVFPADDSDTSEKALIAVRNMLKSVLTYDSTLDMLDAIPKGYSASQIMWDVSEGQADIAGLEWIDPRCITFLNDDFSPRILTVDESSYGIPFPPNKVFWFRYKARSGYDTRAGILRVCAWMYLFKNYAIKDWSSFAEVYGMPLRLGRYDPMANEESRNALIRAVRSLGTDAAGIISKDTEIEFVTASGGSGGDAVYESLVNFCDAQCSKAIRGQVHTASSESKGIGTYGMGKADDSIAYELMEADAVSLAGAINAQIIAPFVRFNFGPITPPVFSFAYKRPENLVDLVPIYQMLAGIGFPLSQEHLSERFGVPMMSKDETPLASRDQGMMMMKQHVLKDSPADDAGMLADRAMKVLSGAESYDDAIRRIGEAFPDMRQDDFERSLASGMFASVLEGYQGGIRNVRP